MPPQEPPHHLLLPDRMHTQGPDPELASSQRVRCWCPPYKHLWYLGVILLEFPSLAFRRRKLPPHLQEVEDEGSCWLSSSSSVKCVGSIRYATGTSQQGCRRKAGPWGWSVKYWLLLILKWHYSQMCENRKNLSHHLVNRTHILNGSAPRLLPLLFPSMLVGSWMICKHFVFFFPPSTFSNPLMTTYSLYNINKFLCMFYCIS